MANKLWLVQPALEDGGGAEIVRAETAERACELLLHHLYPDLSPHFKYFEQSFKEDEENWLVGEFPAAGVPGEVTEVIIPAAEVTAWVRVM